MSETQIGTALVQQTNFWNGSIMGMMRLDLKLMGNIILSLIFIIGIFGCQFSSITRNEKAAFKAFTRLMDSYMKLENIKLKDDVKYVRVKDGVYRSDMNDGSKYLKTVESAWIKDLLEIEDYVHLNANARLSDDYKFVAAMLWAELGTTNSKHLIQSTRNFDELLINTSSISLEYEVIKQLNKSRLFKWVLSNFDNPKEVQDVGSSREYFLRRIIRNYIFVRDYEKALARIRDAEKDGFLINTAFHSIKNEITYAKNVESIGSEFPGTRTK